MNIFIKKSAFSCIFFHLWIITVIKSDLFFPFNAVSQALKNISNDEAVECVSVEEDAFAISSSMLNEIKARSVCLSKL